MLDTHSRIILPSCLVAVTVALALPALAGQDQSPPQDQSVTSIDLVATTAARHTAALRVERPPLVDGDVLGDPAWADVVPATGFRQTAPDEGQPASERTEVRVVFTDDTIYFGIVCYDRDPAAIIVTDSRRDSSLSDSDSVQIILDTFLDQQNGFVFGTSPSGQEYDGQLVNEGAGGSGMGRGGTSRGAGGGFNLNWDGVWQVRTTISDIGWSAEFAIPFRTVRFPTGRTQTWGVNFQRNIRRRNELAYWAPLPRQFDLFRVSMAGRLTGVEAPAGLWRTLQLTPYVVGEALRRSDTLDNRVTALGDIGGDLKVGVTSGLTLDLTYNTDFAQVEVDQQQINLDRFSLFFPEKRPFFLENAGVFTLSNSGGAAFNDPAQTELFFSRRIGIGDGGQATPILGGIRLSGKLSDTVTVGFLNMQTEAVGGSPANNVGVSRLRRELPNRSSIGALFVTRQATGRGADDTDYNRTYGVDGRWGFGQNGLVSGFAAQTETPGRRGEDYAYDMAVDYNAQAWRVRTGYMEMGDNFNPEVGFVRRTGFRKVDGGIFYTVRPDNVLNIQELRPHVTFNRFWNHDDGFIESSLLHMDNFWEFNDSSVLTTTWNIRKEGVVDLFTVSGVPVPPGSYDWNEVSLSYNSDRSAPVTVGARVQRSGFFGGELLSFGPSFGFRRGETLNVLLNWSRNDIDLPAGHVITNLASARVTYNFSPRLFAQSLLQYNDSAALWSVNLRFGWLQDANTGLFLVYNETDGLGDIPHTSAGRTVILKYSYLFDIL
ncbi:MAG: carbohydrate binding family 9 domain-containing protein [Acidobacteria bacterium]|nr:carbohydrate binding family 9 domain-containing protein [Acidobacteriota bacterium]